ncbi:GNAT family N-acetyltransferase [Thalassoroseus pseudoceratinae]|uniref:GNAT family N-acetyltransferase n=1 Tax=Thalassoroseus pseudoceratinae TaxID=2713176 RepID=UPI0014249E34|nr:GNAT family N-acetyltransferase [Thalassoroseus pseudoceratinae]
MSAHQNAALAQRVQVFDASQLDDPLICVWKQIVANGEVFSHPHFSPYFTLAVAMSIPDVKVAVIFEDDAPVAFLPFQQVGKVGYPVGHPFNESHGLVHLPDVWIDAEDLCRKAGLGAWHFDHLPCEQSWLHLYQKATDDAAWVELSGSYQAYLESRQASGTSQLKQAERKRRKLAREVGPVRFEDHIDDQDAVGTLINWKHAQTRGQKSGRVFESEGTKTLLQDVLTIEQPHVRGKLSGLFAGDHLIALHFGMCCHSTYVSMIPAHDDQFSRYSPGMILHLEMIRFACEQGVREIDLGRGINRVKAALMTTTRRLAIGSVDCRPFRRFATNYWYMLRNFAHSSQLGNRMLMMTRQIKSLKN